MTRALASKAQAYADNPAQFIARTHRRKTALLNATCEHGMDCVDGDFLAELYASACLYCGKPAQEADHYQPLARGGRHCRDNLVPACRPCNRSKYAHDPDEWLASLA